MIDRTLKETKSREIKIVHIWWMNNRCSNVLMHLIKKVGFEPMNAWAIKNNDCLFLNRKQIDFLFPLVTIENYLEC